jgi:hypothetical protein
MSALEQNGTGATDYRNYQAAIKQIKMQGGAFGSISDSKRLVEGIKSAFKIRYVIMFRAPYGLLP